MILRILSWAVFGGLVGMLARALLPGRQSRSATTTICLGVLGSFLGGLLANGLSGGNLFAMHPAGWPGSTLGALLVLAAFVFATLGEALSKRALSRSPSGATTAPLGSLAGLRPWRPPSSPRAGPAPLLDRRRRSP